eukprot:g34427.t1
MGDSVFTQLHGCPIGGYLSAQSVAVIKCMVDEHIAITTRVPQLLRPAIYGIRQVDDLLFMSVLPFLRKLLMMISSILKLPLKWKETDGCKASQKNRRELLL